jgi:ankyrin repeat protein
MFGAQKPLCTPEECFGDTKIIALCHAIEEGNIVKIENCISEGADVNVIGKVVTKRGIRKDIPLLLWSFPFGEKVLECLLKHGADTNYLYAEGEKFHKSFLYIALDGWYADPQFRNYVDILLKYGADPDLGDSSPLIPAALHGDYTYHALTCLVEAGADLNKGDIIGGEYPVTAASRHKNYKALLYLLESGATYDVTTIPGGTIQRILYQHRAERTSLTSDQREYIKKHFPGQLESLEENEKNFNKVIKWLEDHGVSFDKPVPHATSTKKPEPVHKKPKVKENVLLGAVLKLM